MAAIGVAISGGGHRATVWGWGALLALRDAGLPGSVVSISSVSGGSIASAVIANAGNYRSMSREDLEAALAPGLEVAARQGLFFFGPSTNRYMALFFANVGLAVGSLVALLVAAAGTARDWPLLWSLVIGPLLVALSWLAVLRRKALPRAIAASLALTLLAAGPISVGFLALTRRAQGWSVVWRLGLPLLATLGLMALLLRVLGKRSQAVDDALSRTLLHREGQPTLLRQVESPVHHVFCATELQAGDHVYFTPRLVYSYRAGRGTPGTLRLSTAVQCSACLPGAFVAREIRTDGFGMRRPWTVEGNEPARVPAMLVVNDGGVYDNMADQWERGYEGRRQRVSELSDLQEPADTLIVVNAGKALGWGPFRRARGLAAEVRGLTRTVDILYDVTTSHRRQGLVERFRYEGQQGLRGVLVHIAQSPYDIPKAFTRSPVQQERERAEEALGFLRSLGADEEAWEARAQQSPRVPTVLKALGIGPTANLLEHAYLLTTVNCYVVLGLGSLPQGDPRFSRSRFDGLARGE